MIEVVVDDEAWTDALSNAAALAEQAAAAALAGADGDVAVLLTDDDAVRVLNARFRQQDRPTNVLSFPAPDSAADALGDIALAFGVCAAEARAQGKPLAHHLQHLVVHGVLHLVGLDHAVDAEAAAMEARERCILAGLGVPDPYAAEPAPTRV
jgi:probable rRNA maturation factor